MQLDICGGGFRKYPELHVPCFDCWFLWTPNVLYYNDSVCLLYPHKKGTKDMEDKYNIKFETLKR